MGILVGPRFAPSAENIAAKKLDFNRDIRPILSENCFQCHGFDEKARQAKLRLDQADSAYAEHDSGKPIVPGHPEQSELWRRITSTDESEMMPPPDSHRALKPAQKETLKLWLEQGAPYAKHWSFIPPAKAPLPDVGEFLRNSHRAGASVGDTRLREWPRNEIDNFILARLAQENLNPSPEADRSTLIRRLSLDLTGLPPSAEEVEAFVADKDPNAYEKLVDRLLASPHFGERMALVWLDAARYADTNGFSIDGGRHMWLWRDWVINAFNTNMPYDQFLREQIAGDLLPKRTEAQLIATGFERNNMNTHEGGTIPEENLTNYNVDRVKTLSEAVLGLTLGCAQCHNHKFDPLTQRDFYQMFAYFNTASDAGLDGNSGINSRPFIQAKTVLNTNEIPTLRKQIKLLKDKLANPRADEVERWITEQYLRLSSRGRDFALHKPELLKISTPNIGSGFDIEPPNFVRITVPTGLLAYDVSMRLPKTEKPITGLRVVFHPDAGGAWGFGTFAASPKKPTFVLTAFSASSESVPGDQVNLNRLLDIASVTADSWLETYRPENVLDTRNENGWSPDPTSKGPVHVTVTFAKPIDPAKTPFLTAQINFGHGSNLIASHFEIVAMTGADDDSDLPREIIDIIQNSPGPHQLAPNSGATGSASASPAPRSSPGATAGSPSSAVSRLNSEQQSELRAYYSAHAGATNHDRIALANLEERLAVLTQKFPTMVMDIAAKPRETHILRRGDYSQPMEKVDPGTPAVLPKLQPAPHQLATNSGATGSASASLTPRSSLPAPASTRLDLANWLTMPDHPLTARVEVNRLWQIFFGTGIVATPADFGAQGQYPTHPELLDWLAVDFREHNWDIKRLAKKIVMSATYRQTSTVAEFLRNSNPKGASVGGTRPQLNDPQNRFLSRGPRFRLPAEFIRDGALKVSGLLVDRLGGPSVNPYTPGNLWREISHYGSTPATAQTFEQDHGEKLYRRSLYTYWKRTVPPPNMVAFDAPNREICTVYRAPTTTPLQALVLLNDVQFVEASRAFAERIIQQNGDESARLRWAFEECVSRLPTSAELAVLKKALARERVRYAANAAAAKKYLANGESARNEKIPVPEHAAWSQVAALLLNLSETVTRN
jgi:hypothetical protein